MGGGPVRHAQLIELERLAGPSAPRSDTPHPAPDFTPRSSPRAEPRRGTRLSTGISPDRLEWLRLPDQEWLWIPDRSQVSPGGLGKLGRGRALRLDHRCRHPLRRVAALTDPPDLRVEPIAGGT